MVGVAMLKLVPLKVWLNIGIAVALGLAIWFVYDWAHQRGQDSRDKEVATLTRSALRLIDANKTNQSTIKKLMADNAAWRSDAKAKSKEALAAVALLATEQARFVKELADARLARKVIYERNPKARDWGNAPVPDAIADRVRTQANRDQDPDR